MVPVTVMIVAAVMAVTSLVLLVTRVARTTEQAQAATSVIGILMGVLGGSFFPISGGGLLARLSDLTPTAAFIRGLGLTNGGAGSPTWVDRWPYSLSLPRSRWPLRRCLVMTRCSHERGVGHRNHLAQEVLS